MFKVKWEKLVVSNQEFSELKSQVSTTRNIQINFLDHTTLDKLYVMVFPDGSLTIPKGPDYLNFGPFLNVNDFEQAMHISQFDSDKHLRHSHGWSRDSISIEKIKPATRVAPTVCTLTSGILKGIEMKPLTSGDEVLALLYAPAAPAALRVAISTGLLWSLAERPMNGEEVSKALHIPGKRGHYWLQYLQSFGILETTPLGYVPSQLIFSTILRIRSRESWQHTVLFEEEMDAGVHGLSQFIAEPGSFV